MKDKNYVVQWNALLSSKQSFNNVEKSLYYCMLNKVDIKGDNETFRLTLKEIQSLVGDKRINFKSYIDGATSLLSKKFYIDKSKSASGMNEIITCLAGVRYKDGVLELQVASMLKPYLIAQKGISYSKIYMNSVFSLKSIYAKRIYEILYSESYKEIFEIEIDEFKDLLNYEAVESKRFYPKWDRFKDRILKPSIDAINSSTNIEVVAIPIKEVRAFKSIRFIIKRKENDTLISFEDETNVVKRMIEKFGLSETQAKVAFLLYNIKELNKLLYSIQTTKIKSNIGAYTANVLNVKNATKEYLRELIEA